MILPRRHYLTLAGVETHQFKALQRRDQVPLIASGVSDLTSKTETEAAEHYDKIDARGYLPAEAIMLAIAEHMVAQNSFSRAAAKQIAQGHWNLLPEAVRRAEAGETIWYAVGSWDFGHEKQGDENGNKGHWSFVETGTFDEVIKAIRKEQDRAAEMDGTVDNIALFDLSLLVRRAHQRAGGLGVTISSFFPARG